MTLDHTHLKSMTKWIGKELELIGKIKEIKRQRDDHFLHYEGETNVEVMYDEKDDCRSNCVSRPDYFEENLKPTRKGPTTNQIMIHIGRQHA